MNDICESCGNRLKTDICKKCRYATESYYEPIEMSFSDAYKKFSEGKTIYRGCGFWNSHNCDSKMFKPSDFLADDWKVFDDEKVFIRKSDYRILENNNSEFGRFKSHVAELIQDEIPELRGMAHSYIYDLILNHSTMAGIRKEMKRR